MISTDILIWISKKLFPNGRAFRVPAGGDLERMYKALSQSDIRLDGDMMQLMNSQLPDNDNYPMEDAIDWYRRLGLYYSGSVTLDNMKQAIARKMSFPVV